MTNLDKAAMRREMKRRRACLASDGGTAAREAATAFPVSWITQYGPDIAIYKPIGSEMDTSPLIKKLSQAGARLSLPCTRQGGAMLYRAYHCGDRLTAHQFGIQEPDSDQPEITPGLIIAPLLAFDQWGNRLGYGKGFYDRSIAALRAHRSVFVCGLAFYGQKVAAIAADDRDVPLNAIVTERGPINFATHS